MRVSSLGLVGPIAGRVFASVFLGLLVTACYVLQGVFLALALAGLLLGEGSRGAVEWIVAFAVVALVRAGLLWVSEVASSATAQAAKAYLRERLLAHLFALGPGVTLKYQTGDLQTTIVAGVEALEAYYSRYLPSVAVAVLGCVYSVI